uniref:ELM2 domain-containing protein n=1 Tax=Tanacetum cinerariifolium TaxID=118510 RepID=A0A6L2K819_TANCI|nr:ELM2 domain-containing protein [Tanacetum cinerariifolium]
MMDIRDEVKASKGDELPKSSLLPDSDQNNPLNKPQLSSGVKGIDHVSPIKLKGTGNSDSPRSRRIMMSERDILVSSNPQPVSQFNPITGELIMSSANVNFSGIASVVSDKLTDLEKDKVNVGKDKAPKHKLTDLEKDKVNVGKDKAPKHKAPVKNPTAVVYKARKQKTSVKKPAAVIEKLDVVVDKTPKHKASAKKPASVVVQDKDNVPIATESDKETEPVVVADVKAPVVAAVEKDNPKVTSKVSDESIKAPVVKESVKASSVVADKPSSVVVDKVNVVKDNINVVADKVVKENVFSVVADKASNINVVAGGTNHYLGPLTFLIVVRTRPAIRNWSSYLMKQRQELELKDRMVGILDLHDEWNEDEVQQSEGFIGFRKLPRKRDNVGDDDDENGDDNDVNDGDGNEDIVDAFKKREELL